ncbi:hypothetical protein L3X38_009269 [Prunus dulcis]|uniref:Uncharacterized protein n=1 Tax=Prunus dulcis TaxID=3755 RepID=A0AAD5F7V2_PRUDU|nr:hypothetical protein L3X38_009269 [Prunus dulcis]
MSPVTSAVLAGFHVVAIAVCWVFDRRKGVGWVEVEERKLCKKRHLKWRSDGEVLAVQWAPLNSVGSMQYLDPYLDPNLGFPKFWVLHFLELGEVLGNILGLGHWVGDGLRDGNQTKGVGVGVKALDDHVAHGVDVDACRVMGVGLREPNDDRDVVGDVVK